MESIKLSQEFLLAVKRDVNTEFLVRELEEKPEKELYHELQSVTSRKTFWINLYNAFTQEHIRKHSPDFSSWKSRLNFFGNRAIIISDHLLSLNDIEHGILRFSSVWWSRGYLKKIFVTGFEKKFRVPLDYRIHFALNCGAASCPAIAFYDAAKIDEQLDEAMKSFLEAEVKFDKRSNTVYISPIFRWYRGDFDGNIGIINLLWRRHLLPAEKKVRLRFNEYDWTIHASKFLNEGKV